MGKQGMVDESIALKERCTLHLRGEWARRSCAPRLSRLGVSATASGGDLSGALASVAADNFTPTYATVILLGYWDAGLSTEE
jgi:hypothetical protein